MHTIALLQILFLSLIGGKKHTYVIWNHVLIFTNMQFSFFSKIIYMNFGYLMVELCSVFSSQNEYYLFEINHRFSKVKFLNVIRM